MTHVNASVRAGSSSVPGGRRGGLRGWLSTVALPGAAALALAAAGVVASAPSAAATTYASFSYTGGVQYFTVPSQVSSIEVTAFGAQGQPGLGGLGWNGSGGRGGSARTTLAVTPGQVFQINVGGQAGFNGGGAGSSGISVGCNGGAGGGASDVRSGDYGLNDRLLVAGGGGGGGNGDAARGGDGGAGGGARGTAGVKGTDEAAGGEPGTAAAGGAAGASGAAGEDGTAGTGGAGGPGTDGADGCGGGGGGGGWFGGGGGSGLTHADHGRAIGSAGGGGGSGYGPTGTTLESGIRSGDGRVEITYTKAPADVGVTVADSADPVVLGDTFTATVTVTNHGPNEAEFVDSGISLSGAPADIVSVTTTKGVCPVNNKVIHCALFAMAPYTSVTVTVTVSPTATGVVTTRAYAVSSENLDSEWDNNNAVQYTSVQNAGD